MEETEDSNGNKKSSIQRRRNLRVGGANSHEHNNNHYQHNQFEICNNQNNKYQRYCPALLPLPSFIPLQQLALTPPFPQNHTIKSKTHFQKYPCKLNNNHPFAASSDNNNVSEATVSPGNHSTLLSLYFHRIDFLLKFLLTQNYFRIVLSSLCVYIRIYQKK